MEEVNVLISNTLQDDDDDDDDDDDEVIMINTKLLTVPRSS